MRFRVLLCGVVLVGSFALFALAGPGFADPNVPDIRPHQHFVVTAQGAWIPIGPQVCPAGSSPQLQRAFNQFHLNIHHSFFPDGTPIESNGPPDGAPGLHNSTGADMQGRPCDFVPPPS